MMRSISIYFNIASKYHSCKLSVSDCVVQTIPLFFFSISLYINIPSTRLSGFSDIKFKIDEID